MLPRYYYDDNAARIVAGGSAFAAAVLALSPTRYYRLGEPSGTNAVDATGTQDATYTNTPTLGVAGITTDGDTGITLASGSSQYVTATDHADYDVGTNDWSVMFGLYVSSWPAGNMGIINRDGYGGGAWGITIVGGSNGYYRVVMNGLDYLLDVGASAGSGAWRFIGISVDRSASATLYLAGTSADTVDVSAAVATDLQRTAPLYIGRNAAGIYLDGSLDEVAFWNGYLVQASEWATLEAAR
jgi:hypothetical protein